MSGSIGNAGATPRVPAAWRDHDVESTERAEVARIKADVDGKLAAANTELEAATPAYEVYQEHFAAAGRSEQRWMLGSVAAGTTVIGAGIGAFAAGRGMRLLGAGLGVTAGALLGGVMALFNYRDSPRPTQFKATPEDQAAIDRYVAASKNVSHTIGREADPPWLFQQRVAQDWKVGEAGNAHMRSSVRDFVATNAAAFDHDGDGAVDVSQGSPELVRDDNGGPVTSSTRAIRNLPAVFAKADADGDQRVTPEEAVLATVRTAITSDSYYWDSGAL
jgi:hypothetical protein